MHEYDKKTLPPPVADPVCPKCGEREIAVRYKQHSGDVNGTVDFAKLHGINDGFSSHPYNTPEMLLHTCRRCDYVWPTATLDQFLLARPADLKNEKPAADDSADGV